MSLMKNSLFACGLVSITLLLTACGGGAGTTENPDLNNTVVASYTGPAPANTDVQAFSIELWSKLNPVNRCGSCHVEGDQAPMFVRLDDVNAAYTAASSVVNLTAPEESALVTKVAAGHNCWLPTSAACGELITGYIAAWAGGNTGGTSIIALQPPAEGELKEPGSSKHFPAASAGFNGIHNLLTQHCQECHVESSDTPQSPFFADASIDAAYAAAQAAINLNTPADSRVVVRLRDEFHNCWSDCGSDASDLLDEINTFAGPISSVAVNSQLVFSKAMGLNDGTVASGGSRYDANVIARYEFKTGQGTTAIDSSGIEPALNLSLSGDISWVGGWGIQIKSGKAQGSTTASKKLTDLIRAVGEYSIEAWVAPANVSQEDARIISYSGSTTSRNFMLGQTLYNYDFMNRNGNSDANGEPALSTNDDDEDLQATLQHVVVTYDPVNGRRVYVNGEDTEDADTVATSNLNDWDNSFAFVLGNEVSGDRQWQGVIKMVAIHNRALSADQVQQNFAVGVGEKFFLMFNVALHTGIENSYVVFEVSQFDSYAYLFANPVFRVLGDNPATPQGVPLKGLRIGINGKQASVGQAYQNLDLTIGGSAYTSEAGQSLSTAGTIISLENGADADEFFLTFEQIGNSSNVTTDPGTSDDVKIALETTDETVPDIGLRLFDEVNASMSELTGVSMTESRVQATFDLVRQQLPAVENLSGFLSAHQVGVSQLAIEYCNSMVDDTALRDLFFLQSGFNGFGSNVASAFPDLAAKNQVADALYYNLLGASEVANDPTGDLLTRAPTLSEIRDVLINGGIATNGQTYTALFTSMASNCGSCDTQSTDTIVKGMCAAILGSAAMLIQ
ncbi:MAG: LamG domain-containing protein [Gammaproteobacteria bacterium]